MTESENAGIQCPCNVMYLKLFHHAFFHELKNSTTSLTCYPAGHRALRARAVASVQKQRIAKDNH